jgi:hypothetical protein
LSEQYPQIEEIPDEGDCLTPHADPLQKSHDHSIPMLSLANIDPNVIEIIGRFDITQTPLIVPGVQGMTKMKKWKMKWKSRTFLS